MKQEVCSLANVVGLDNLSDLVINMERLPKEEHGLLMQLMVNQLNELNFFTICLFMMDSILHGRSHSHEFLNQLHEKLSQRLPTNCYRYAYLLFVGKYMDKYISTYPIMEGGRKYFTLDHLYSFEMTYNFTKMLAL